MRCDAMWWSLHFIIIFACTSYAPYVSVCVSVATLAIFRSIRSKMRRAPIVRRQPCVCASNLCNVQIEKLKKTNPKTSLACAISLRARMCRSTPPVDPLSNPHFRYFRILALSLQFSSVFFVCSSERTDRKPTESNNREEKKKKTFYSEMLFIFRCFCGIFVGLDGAGWRANAIALARAHTFYNRSDFRWILCVVVAVNTILLLLFFVLSATVCLLISNLIWNETKRSEKWRIQNDCQRWICVCVCVRAYAHTAWWSDRRRR